MSSEPVSVATPDSTGLTVETVLATLVSDRRWILAVTILAGLVGLGLSGCLQDRFTAEVALVLVEPTTGAGLDPASRSARELLMATVAGDSAVAERARDLADARRGTSLPRPEMPEIDFVSQGPLLTLAVTGERAERTATFADVLGDVVATRLNELLTPPRPLAEDLRRDSDRARIAYLQAQKRVVDALEDPRRLELQHRRDALDQHAAAEQQAATDADTADRFTAMARSDASLERFNAQLRELQRTRDTAWQTHVAALERLAAIEKIEAEPEVAVRRVSAAAPRAARVGPNHRLNTIASGLVGFLLAAGWSLLQTRRP